MKIFEGTFILDYQKRHINELVIRQIWGKFGLSILLFSGFAVQNVLSEWPLAKRMYTSAKFDFLSPKPPTCNQ